MQSEPKKGCPRLRPGHHRVRQPQSQPRCCQQCQGQRRNTKNGGKRRPAETITRSTLPSLRHESVPHHLLRSYLDHGARSRPRESWHAVRLQNRDTSQRPLHRAPRNRRRTKASQRRRGRFRHDPTYLKPPLVGKPAAAPASLFFPFERPIPTVYKGSCLFVRPFISHWRHTLRFPCISGIFT
jgi:hypothetical protein